MDLSSAGSAGLISWKKKDHGLDPVPAACLKSAECWDLASRNLIWSVSQIHSLLLSSLALTSPTQAPRVLGTNISIFMMWLLCLLILASFLKQK